ncbi:endonuclease domain-containing protein [Aequorivita todarodis]|uniref:endonuclease domain-containing protein n=1 Tax=Aequorivita todarodis TaxID=2036821 RepID=UPI002350ACD2|nr:endonuclease domain-containing protein [Aequorivita todarodis]MDC8000256.1 endonuclease domain-containing protein [Aequorivita todarodis]
MSSFKNNYKDIGMHKGAPPKIFAIARILRNKMTPAETKLWEHLKNNQMEGFKFRRQHPIHLFIADFYCHKLGLIIELDGEYHNEEEQMLKDKERTELLNFQNVSVIRFKNEEVENEIEKVLAEIKSFINNTQHQPRP